MRKSTREFIKEHRGETYRCKTRTLEFTSVVTGEKIPSQVAEELDRLDKFNKSFGAQNKWVLEFTIK